jgi:hypothetical protein
MNLGKEFMGFQRGFQNRPGGIHEFMGFERGFIFIKD